MLFIYTLSYSRSCFLLCIAHLLNYECIDFLCRNHVLLLAVSFMDPSEENVFVKVAPSAKLISVYLAREMKETEISRLYGRKIVYEASREKKKVSLLS